MTETYPGMLAVGLTDEGSITPFELYAGESQTVTDSFTAHTDLAQFAVCMRHSDNTIKAWDGTAGAAMCITAQPILSGVKGPAFISGFFNYNVLGWNSHAATLLIGQTAFDRSTIKIGVPKGVATAMTYP